MVLDILWTSGAATCEGEELFRRRWRSCTGRLRVVREAVERLSARLADACGPV